MDNNYQIFRPTAIYWLKSWIPAIAMWCIVLVYGIQENIGTPTFNRALGFSIFSSFILTGLILLVAQQHIILTDQGLFIRVVRKSYFWAWEQIDAVHFYAIGEEGKQKLLVSTKEGELKFDIHAFDDAKLEDAITAFLGSELVGLGAYFKTARYIEAEEKFKSELNRLGETRRYVGGPVNALLYWYAIFTGFTFFALFLLLAKIGMWFWATLFLALAVFGFLRPLSLSGSFYMNRNHIVCKRPWQTHMMWWRDVKSVTISFRYIIFHGKNACLVAPGILFWGKKGAKKLDRLLTQQINERLIGVEPTDIFSFPRNKNVRTNRFD